MDEVSLAQAAVDYLAVLSELSGALRLGKVDGVPGDLNVESIDLMALDAAIGLAGVGCRSAEVDKLLHTTKIMRNLRAAVKANNWEVRTLFESDVFSCRPGTEGAIRIALHVAPGCVLPVTGGNQPSERTVAVAATHSSDRLPRQLFMRSAEGTEHTRDETDVVPFTLSNMINENCLEEHSVPAILNEIDEEIVDEAVAEIMLVRDELYDRVLTAKLTQALSHGVPEGKTGSLDLSNVETRVLDIGIQIAAHLGCQSPRATGLYVTACLIRELRDSMLKHNWSKVQACLVAVSSAREDGNIAGIAEAEIIACHRQLNHTIIRQQLMHALSEGSATGEPGAMQLDNINTQELKKGIAAAFEVGCPSEETRRLLASAESIYRLRNALKSGNWEQVRQTLRGIDVDSLSELSLSEVRFVEDECSDRLVVSSLTFALSSGANADPRARFAAATAMDSTTRSSSASTATALGGTAGAELDDSIRLAEGELTSSTHYAKRLLVTAKYLQQVRCAWKLREWETLGALLRMRDHTTSLVELVMAELDSVQNEWTNHEVFVQLSAVLTKFTLGDYGGAQVVQQLVCEIEATLAMASRAVQPSKHLLALQHAAELVRKSSGDLPNDAVQALKSVLLDDYSLPNYVGLGRLEAALK
jgi:hypothetical protein